MRGELEELYRKHLNLGLSEDEASRSALLDYHKTLVEEVNALRVDAGLGVVDTSSAPSVPSDQATPEITTGDQPKSVEEIYATPNAHLYELLKAQDDIAFQFDDEIKALEAEIKELGAKKRETRKRDEKKLIQGEIDKRSDRIAGYKRRIDEQALDWYEDLWQKVLSLARDKGYDVNDAAIEDESPHDNVLTALTDGRYMENVYHKMTVQEYTDDVIAEYFGPQEEEEREEGEPAKDSKPDREFSSTQIDLPPDIAAAVIKFGERFVDDDQIFTGEDAPGDGGRELEPHVTVKFGLKTNSPADVEKIVSKEKPFPIELHGIGFFDREDSPYAVVYIKVESPRLHKLNTKVAKLPNGDTHPDYTPHVTLAYVKKSAVKQLRKKAEPYNSDSVARMVFDAEAVTFSAKDRSKTVIPLGGQFANPTDMMRGAVNADAITPDNIDAIAGIFDKSEAAIPMDDWRSNLFRIRDYAKKLGLPWSQMKPIWSDNEKMIAAIDAHLAGLKGEEKTDKPSPKFIGNLEAGDIAEDGRTVVDNVKTKKRAQEILGTIKDGTGGMESYLNGKHKSGWIVLSGKRKWRPSYTERTDGPFHKREVIKDVPGALRVGDRFETSTGETGILTGLSEFGLAIEWDNADYDPKAKRVSQVSGGSTPLDMLPDGIFIHPEVFTDEQIADYEQFRRYKPTFGSMAWAHGDWRVSPRGKDLVNLHKDATDAELQKVLKTAENFNPNDYPPDHREGMETERDAIVKAITAELSRREAAKTPKLPEDLEEITKANPNIIVARPAKFPAPDVFDEEFSALFGDETLSGLEQARQSAADALKNTRAGLEEAGKGLLTMFDPKKFKTAGIPSFDEKTYADARPMFIQAIAHFKMAGQDTRSAIKSLLTYLKEELGASAETIFNMKPYIVRFAGELEKGEVKFEQPPMAPEKQAFADDMAALTGEEYDEEAVDAHNEAAGYYGESGMAQTGRTDYGDVNKANVPALATAFQARFSQGKGFRNIIEARALASQLLKGAVQPGSPAAKAVDEAIELAGVMQARDIIEADRENGVSRDKTYDKIRFLSELMPSLNVRTSQSIIEQAYSTPLPIAYVASQLAGIDPTVSAILEPAAGNGSLLIEAAPSQVVVNELNPGRAKNLRAIGFKDVTTDDAAIKSFNEGMALVGRKPNATIVKTETTGGFEVVITNPPFGVVQKDGRPVSYEIKPPNGQNFETNEIDHAIVFNALNAMSGDGRAVLIVGGVKADTDKSRSDKYNGAAKRKFYYQLYKNYNVIGHFGLDGSLYSKQGANYPVDMIVINGRGESKLALPAAKLPRQIKTWDELKELLNEQDLLAAGQRTGRNDVTESQDRDRDRDAEGAADGRADVLEFSGRQGAGSDRQGGRAGERGGRDTRADDRGGLGGERTGRDEERGARADTRESESTSLPNQTGSARDIAEEDVDKQPESPADDRGDGLGSVADFHDGRGARRLIRPEEGSLQVTYEPQSSASSVDTLLPVNLQEPVMRALENLEARVGSIDRYVEAKLDFPPGTFEKTPFLSAEQIDALGLGIWNLESEKGFIIGDQTGVGKGRFIAGIIKYALLNSKTPIFVTEKPNLYADMFRDLIDIGLSPDELQILATNNSLRLPLDEDETVFLKTKSADAHNQTLSEVIREGRLVEHNMLFTTYSQMQTVAGGKRTIRHELLESLIPNAIIIFDESHNAGGQETKTRDGQVVVNVNKEGIPILSRAQFARQLVEKASGAVYSSATYAKRPSVMSLYAATDMRLAVDNIEKLGPAIEHGGVPLQQVVAGMLAEAGQYIRREKSFDGIVFEKTSVPIRRDTAATITKILKGIQIFDELKQIALGALDSAAKEEGLQQSTDGSTGRAGVESTNFTSIMHNLIDQMLLTMKVDSTIERVIEAHKAGEKPVIALANTMGSFIEQYVKDFDMNPGDGLALDFSDVLMRYLTRSRDVVETDWEGNKVRRPLTDEELGDYAVKAFKHIEKEIQNADLSEIPLSPIDYMHAKLREAGIRSGEITGRQHTLKYLTTTPTEFPVKNAAGEVVGTTRHLTSTYEIRPQALIKPQGRRKMINAFNNGQLDVLILNQAGSTGLSLHASPVFKERPIKPRVMYVLQAERNIDTFMQILGRVNRTGQQHKPRYELMTGNIPAENRPAAILMNKMAMLNANTTGSRKGKAKDESVTDFMNQYGDFVVAELMWDMPDVHRALGKPLKINDTGDGFLREGAARKVTGWVPLLPLEEQERIYGIIEQAYIDLIAQLDAMGENSLEAKKYDLQARPVSSEVVREGFGSSPFSQPAIAEQLDIRKLGKPFTTEQVKAMVLGRLDLKQGASRGEVQNQGAVVVRDMMDSAKADFQNYRSEELEKVADNPDRVKAEQEKLRVMEGWFHNAMHLHVVGGEYLLASMQGATYGVLIDVRRKGNTKNPLAGGDWEMTFATTDASRQLKLNLRKLEEKSNSSRDLQLDELERISSGKILFKRVGKGAVAVDGKGGVDVYDAFDLGQQEAREVRTMITGNLLAGYSQFAKGQIIFFTTEEGETRQGILMPKDFSLQKAIEAKPVIFRDENEALAFLEAYPNRAVAKSEDGDLTLRFGYGQYTFIVPASSKRGGRYFKNAEILKAADPHQFIKSGSSMMLKIENAEIARAVVRAAGREGTQWQVTALKNEARQFIDDYRKSNAPKPDESTPPLYHVRSAADADRLVQLRDTGNLGAILPGVASVNHKTYIEISPEASELLMSAYDNAKAKVDKNAMPEPATDGTMLEPDQVDLILSGLHEFEELAEKRGYADKLAGVRDLSQNIKKMAKRYKGAVALAVFEDTVPHETTHLFEFTGSVDKQNPQGKARIDRYDNPQQFADDEDFKTVWNSLNELRGFELDLGTALSEGLAYLATAEFEMLGLDKPRAVKLLVKMIKSYEKANGSDAIKNFNETGARLLLETLEQEGYEQRKKQKSTKRKKVDAGDKGEGDGQDDDDGGTPPQQSPKAGTGSRKPPRRPSEEEPESGGGSTNGRKLRSFQESLKREGYDVESEEYDPQSHEETELLAEEKEHKYGSVADAVTQALIDTQVSAESMRVLLRDIERKARLLERLNDEGAEEEADVVREEMATLISQTAENLTNIGRAEEIVKTILPLSMEAAKLAATRLKQNTTGDPQATLTPDEQKAIEELTKNNRELRDQLDKAEAELEQLRPTKIELTNAQRVIERLLKKLDEKRKKGGRKPGSRLYTREEKKVQEIIAVNFESSLERLQKMLRGVATPTHSVNQTGTDAFKRWFGRSKVVDENGIPLKPSHGTLVGGFDVFDLSRAGSNMGEFGNTGMMFALDRSVSTTYADARYRQTARDNQSRYGMSLESRRDAHEAALAREEDTVVETGQDEEGWFYTLKTYDQWGSEADFEDSDRYDEETEAAEAGEAEKARDVAQARKRLDDYDAKERAELERLQTGSRVYDVYLRIENPKIVDLDGDVADIEFIARTNREAKRDGYDGVIYRDAVDALSGDRHAPTDLFTVFESSQIKSATDNRGTFDTSDKSILHSVAKPTRQEMEDLIVVGTNVLQKGLREVEEYGKNEFYADMIAMLNKSITPHLPEIHAKSQIRLEQTRRAVRQKALRERYRSIEGNENLADAEIDVIAANDIAERALKRATRRQHAKAARDFTGYTPAELFANNPRLVKEIQELTDEAEVAFAAILLKLQKGKSINSILTAIQDEYGVMPDESHLIAQRGKALLVSMNESTKPAAQKAKEAEVDDINVRMRKAEMELSRFLSQLVRPQNLRERFSNDLRAKVVLNYATQLFNVIQSVVNFIPQQVVMDLANTAQHRALGLIGRPPNVGELPPARFRDAFLAYKYLVFNNKEVADGLLARFPDIYFQIKKGLMTDIELGRKHQIARKGNRVTKALHRFFDKQDKVNTALARWTFAKTQEEWMRDAMVVATLDQIVRARHGRTLTDILKKGHQHLITEKQMQEAADRALTITAAAPLEDPVGKSLKAFSDWMDKHFTILVNPVWFARFTYTVTKSVANSLAWGALDATKGFGKGEYTTRSFAKGVMGWGFVGMAYALLASFGGDDDKWYHLYFFGKDKPPVDARRWFPMSAYLFTAHVIKSLIEGRKAPRGMDWLEGLASFEGEQYGKTPAAEFIKHIMGLEKDSEGDAYGSLAARELGVVLSGYFRFLSPFKTIYQQIDAEEAAYRKYGPNPLDQFVKEIAKTFPVQRAYGAEKRIDPVTQKPIAQPYPALRLVGINLTAPGFLRSRPTVATEVAFDKFPSAHKDEERTQEEKDAYTIRVKLQNEVRLQKASALDVDKIIDRYVAEGQLTKKSGEYTKLVMRFTQLQDILRRNFQVTDPKDVTSLGEILKKATPEEVYQIRGILLYKQERVAGNADERRDKEARYDSLLKALTETYGRFKGGAFTESESVLMQATTPKDAIKRFWDAPDAEKPYLERLLKQKKREFDVDGKEAVQETLNTWRKLAGTARSTAPAN